MVSEKELKEKAKKISIYEGSAYSFSEGFGLRNVSAYALALGASNSLISFFTSIPSLVGNFSQLLSYRILKKTTRKKAVSFLVFLQAVFWLFLIIPGIVFLKNRNFSIAAVLILLFFYTLLIICGSISGPLWTSWMKDIVDEKELGRYFSKRNKIVLVLVVLSSLVAGLILDFFKEKEVLIGFFILFLLSFLARSFSAYLFTKKYEPKYREKKESYFSLNQFIANLPYNNFGRFVIFLVSINFFVAIASPFFVVYLLKMKGMSYTLYSITLFINTISTLLFMSFWGKLSDKKGDVIIFKNTLIGISIIPLAYFLSSFVSNNLFFIVIIFLTEIISGFCWGGFNLASSNFVFRIVNKEKMVYCSTYLNILNGIGIFIGALFGGYITSKETFLINSVLLVFLISFVGRILTYFVFLPKVKEEKGFFSYDKKNLLISFFDVSLSSFFSNSEFSFIKKIKNQLRLSKTF